MKRTSILASIILLVMLLCSCSKNSEPISNTGIYFDTVISIKLYDIDDSGIIDECFDKCAYYENVFSKTKKSSELYKLNHGELEPVSKEDTSVTYKISDDLVSIVDRGLEYSKITDGSFDITIEPLSSLWNFGTDSATGLPSNDKITEAAKKINYKNVKIDKENGTITLIKNEAKDSFPTIELGALAKGYIADELCTLLKDRGCNSAIIDLGGNIMCLGNKPDDSAFTVGIKKPFSENEEYASYVSCKNVSVVTSGIYERYFEEDGRLYHHLLNPKTGYPIDNSLYSVTIISDSSFTADCLSTVCFSLGLDAGMELINQTDNTEAVFITSDDELHFSDNAKDYIK